MSRFRILRVDHYNPVSVGKKNRLLYTIFGLIPTLFILSFQIIGYGSTHYNTKLIISILILAIVYYFLLRKIRSNNNLMTIGDIEITQSGLKKRLGDVLTEYNFVTIKDLTLQKHLPSTSPKESKSRYFSYILKITLTDGSEESLVVSDRSIDHDHKISILETFKTLKKIVNFDVIIDC